MSNRFALRIALALVAMFTAFSCSKEKAREMPCGGVVTFHFSTGALQTRATAPGDGEVADGGGIYASGGSPDLVILIAATDHSIVKRYCGTDPSSDGELQSLTDTEASIAFDFSTHPAGDYTVYAFGNAEGLWSMTTDGSNTLTAADLMDPAKIADETDILALQFRPLAADTAPALVDLGNPSLARLPVSAYGDLEVSSNKNGQVRLELVRCVAKVTAEFVNNSGETLTLTDFSNSYVGLCPDRGYVLPHEPDKPAGTVSGDLEASEASISIPNNGHISQQWFVFPGTGPYTCNVSFRVGGTPYSYSDMPVTNSRRQDIPALARNQHLHIVTHISKGLKASFNFEVADWEEHEEEVTFL